jgi:hypothetical protein
MDILIALIRGMAQDAGNTAAWAVSPLKDRLSRAIFK